MEAAILDNLFWVIFLLAIFVGFPVAAVVSACMRSSQISRDERARRMGRYVERDR